MPLLARMLASPLFIDIRRGRGRRALATCSTSATSPPTGHVAGRGRARRRARRSGERDRADAARRDGRSRSATRSLDVGRRAAGRAAASAGTTPWSAIGGGRTLDVAKYAATRAGAADGRGGHQPRARRHRAPRSPRWSTRTARAPSAWRCRWRSWSTSTTSGPPRRSWSRSGVGDVVSNLSAIEDWLLAAARARRAGRRSRARVRAHRGRGGAAPHRLASSRDDFLIVAGRGAGAVRAWRCRWPGRRRPCSGACHEIIHAVDALFPGVVQPRRAGRRRAPLFATFLRGDTERFDADRRLPAPARACRGSRPTRAHRASSSPRPSLAAPSTRPDRYTILEHLALDEDADADHA